MVDKDTIIRGCEYWVEKRKFEPLWLEYSAVVELLEVLKDLDNQKKCCRDCEYYGACHDQEAVKME